jgi:hypothetical protein
MTPPTTDSTMANSPAYRPLAMRTLLPWAIPARPVMASRLMFATRAAACAALAAAASVAAGSIFAGFALKRLGID